MRFNSVQKCLSNPRLITALSINYAHLITEYIFVRIIFLQCECDAEITHPSFKQSHVHSVYRPVYAEERQLLYRLQKCYLFDYSI